MEAFDRSHLQNIKTIFEEKTGVALHERAAVPRPVRRIAVLAAVLAGVLMLTCCVAAATFDVGGLFKLLFSRQQNAPVSDEQGVYVDSHSAAIGECVEQNGVSVTLTGAISDGVMAYLWLDIAAPEGVKIEQLPLAFNGEFVSLRQAGQEQDSISSISPSCVPLADNDGRENTAALLIQYRVYQPQGSNFSFNDGRTRTLRLEDLFYREQTYPYAKKTVVEGTWEYTFAFTAVEERETELLAAPLSASYCQISGREVEANVFSIRIRGLSAVICYTLAPDAVQEAGDFGILTFVKKDGSTLRAYPEKAGQTAQIENGELVPNSDCHYCAYAFDAPLCYEDLAALYLGDRAVDIVIP